MHVWSTLWQLLRAFREQCGLMASPNCFPCTPWTWAGRATAQGSGFIFTMFSSRWELKVTLFIGWWNVKGKCKSTVIVIYMGLPRPLLVVLLHPALMLRKVVLLRPLFSSEPCATFRLHLFSSGFGKCLFVKAHTWEVFLLLNISPAFSLCCQALSPLVKAIFLQTWENGKLILYYFSFMLLTQKIT